MSSTLKLEIITPGETAYSADVQMVTLLAVNGQIGIYPSHVALLTRILPGEMIVRKDGRDESQSEQQPTHLEKRSLIPDVADNRSAALRERSMSSWCPRVRLSFSRRGGRTPPRVDDFRAPSKEKSTRLETVRSLEPGDDEAGGRTHREPWPMGSNHGLRNTNGVRHLQGSACHEGFVQPPYAGGADPVRIERAGGP